MAALAILVATVALAQALGNREEYSPARKDFTSFPVEIGEWKGRHDRLEKIYLDILKLMTT